MNLEAPSKAIRWPVVRVAPGHDVAVVLLSGDWFRLVTHFYQRTVLCPDSDACSLCALLPSRPYWYLPCLVQPRKTRALLELSATASADLEQRAKMLHGGIGAGMTVRLARRSSRRPVYCEIMDNSVFSPRLSLATWITAVMAIYGFSAMKEDETVVSYGARIQASVIERAGVVASRLQAVCSKGVLTQA